MAKCSDLIPTLIVCLILMNNVFPSEQFIMKAIKIGQTLFDVAKFALDLHGLLNDGDGGNTGQVDQLVKEIPKLIEASTTTIIKHTILVSKLERIDDAVIAVHSSLVDIERMLTSNGTERNDYKDLFKINYENSNLITHIRFLPSLLTYEIPGTSGTLMDLWIDNTRCNMTALYEFKRFYFGLVASGMGIEAMYNAMVTENGISITDTLEDWEPRIKSMNEVFDTYGAICKGKFEQLVREDIRNSNDVSQLMKNLNQRYPYKKHDVYSLKTPGTFQMIYYESNDDLIIWEQVSDSTRLVVSIDLDDLNNFNNVNDIDGERFRSWITSEEDINAARHVGIGVKKQLSHDTGDDVLGLISYVDDGGCGYSLNEDSPVTRIELNDVSLRYCHKTGFECVFTGKEAVHGKMKIFVYLRSPRTGTDETSTSVIGSAPKTHMPSLYTIILIGFFTACFCCLLD